MSQVDDAPVEAATKDFPVLNTEQVGSTAHAYPVQINHCKDQIRQNHPLSDIPLLKALPYLSMVKCCLKKPKKNFRNALRRSLLKRLEIKMPKSDIKLEEDPYLLLGKKIVPLTSLGYGMNAYYDFIKSLGILFLLIAIFSIPAMSIFAKYGAIVGQPKGIITQFSLGNMGKILSRPDQILIINI